MLCQLTDIISEQKIGSQELVLSKYILERQIEKNQLIMFRNLGFITLILFLQACMSESRNAEKIVDAAIQRHGGKLYENSEINFTFRDRQYKRKRKGGIFSFQRIFTDTTGRVISDLLTNDNFIRDIDEQQVQLSEEDVQKYTASVNSVIYFSLLPYRLNDAAVIKKYIGENEINGKPYHKIEVTFNQNGGGEDFQDIFVYWVHQKEATVDFIAYSYAEEDGTGVRFREAYNVREINGIRFSNYINYKGDGGIYPGDLDEMFKKEELEILSRIDLEDIEVKILSEEETPLVKN